MPPLPTLDQILPIVLAFLAPQVILFLTFALGAVATAITMVLYPNPIRSALFLVLNLFCVAVLYLLLHAYFLAAVQVVVYAGAIMVLFLFVIMLLNLGTPDRSVDKLRWQQPVAIVGGLVFAIVVSLSVFASSSLPQLDKAGNAPERAIAKLPERKFHPGLTAGDVAVAPAGAPATPGAPAAPGPPSAFDPNTSAEVLPDGEETASGMPTPAEQGTVVGIGKYLYAPSYPYLFPFEITSILLLIAVIGSVVLAKRRMPGESLASSRVSEGDF